MALNASEAQKKHLVTRDGGIRHNTSTQEAKDGDPSPKANQDYVERYYFKIESGLEGKRERKKSRKHIVFDRSFRHAIGVGWVSENETPKSNPGTC